MKTLNMTSIAGLLLALSGAAQADLSGNLGWASEYHFRGIFQHSSSASGGLDYEEGGFYAGTWAADVGDGLEVDVYAGFGGEVGDFTYSIGGTGYFYTGDFDDTYKEVNLGLGYGIASVDVAIGSYENFAGPSLDYTYYALTLAAENGLYATVAGFSQDFEGEYIELGYGTTVTSAEIDVGIALILANDDLIGESDESLVFTIGKAFDIN